MLASSRPFLHFPFIGANGLFRECRYRTNCVYISKAFACKFRDVRCGYSLKRGRVTREDSNGLLVRLFMNRYCVPTIVLGTSCGTCLCCGSRNHTQLNFTYSPYHNCWSNIVKTCVSSTNKLISSRRNEYIILMGHLFLVC